MSKPKDLVDHIILTIRDHERRSGLVPRTINDLQPVAEALIEAGIVHISQVQESIEEWRPMFSFSSLGRLSDTERQAFEDELNHQAETARAELMKDWG